MATRGSEYVPAPLRDAKGDELRLARQVQRGLAFAKLNSLAMESGLGLDSVAKAIRVPPRTLVRRKQSGRLTLDESERLVRVSRVLGQAVRLFEGNKKAAIRWLEEPKAALGGQSPWDVARTGPGARQVETLIQQLDQGLYA